MFLKRGIFASVSGKIYERCIFTFVSFEKKQRMQGLARVKPRGTLMLAELVLIDPCVCVCVCVFVRIQYS